MNLDERAGKTEFIEAQKHLFLTKVDASQPFSLTSEQKGARQFILDCITNQNINPNTIVVIKGLPGTGKSTVVNESADSFIQACGASAANVNELINSPRHPNSKSLKHDRLMVTTATPAELEAIKEKFPDFTILQHTIKAMDVNEARTMFDRYMNNRHLRMPDSKLQMFLKCSMGVPYLIDRLANSDISEDGATQIAFRYLVENFRDNNSDIQSELSDNFNIFPPDEAIGLFRETRGNWNKILTQIMSRASQNGIQLDPVIFSVYSKALENPISNQVGIFVPQISQEAYEKIGQALGFLRKGWPVQNIRALRKSNAFKMLEADTRKMLLWIRQPNNFTQVIASKEITDVSAEKDELEMMSKQLNIQDSEFPTASLFLHAHEHYGNINHFLAALAMEIQLRKYDLPYVMQGIDEQPLGYDSKRKEMVSLRTREK